MEVQRAQVEALGKGLPEAPEGPPVQLVSVDGAMVPLVGRQWAEVKTLAIGTVEQGVLGKGEMEAHTKDLTYFSRLADHETFARLATVETHRRGTENAEVVCAVVDGAEWEQQFIDLHCPNAVRILDFAHAAEYVAKAAQAVFGVGTVETSQWLEVQLHELKHGDPQKVLGKLRGLREELAAQADGGRVREALEAVTTSLEYLEKRQAQIRYADFLAAGYPIGSGAVESANKLVVEARLKGAGMHWAREHVNPMVALRTIACSDRWEEAWPQISERLREEAKERRERCRPEGKAEREPRLERGSVSVERLAASEPDELAKVACVVNSGSTVPEAPPTTAVIGATDGSAATAGARRPSADHPWRHMPIGRARFRPSRSPAGAET